MAIAGADIIVCHLGLTVGGSIGAQTALKLEDGKLTFKTSYADPIALAWDQVASLAVTEALVLPSNKGKLNVTSIERADNGLIVTTSSGPSTLDPADVTILRSSADQSAYETSLNPSWGHAWAGAVNLSLALARGNSETATFGAGFGAARQTRNDKTSLYANTLYSKNSHAVPSQVQTQLRVGSATITI